jgi:hypothetical protein
LNLCLGEWIRGKNIGYLQIIWFFPQFLNSDSIHDHYYKFPFNDRYLICMINEFSVCWHDHIFLLWSNQVVIILKVKKPTFCPKIHSKDSLHLV